MNVLMVSLADSVFRGDGRGGNTLARQSHYLDALRRLEPDSSLTALVYTTRPFSQLSPRQGLTFIPVRAARVQLLPLLGLITALRATPRLRPDVITAQNPLEAGLLGLFLSRLYRVPLEVQVHFDLLSPYWLRERPIWNRVRSWTGRRVLARADAVRVVSSPLKQGLMETLGISEDRIAIIPVPVFFDHAGEGDDHGIGPGLPVRPSSSVVLFVGRLCHPKNLPGLFAILHRVLPRHTNAEFVVLGDGPQRPYAEQRAAALDASRIHVVGAVPYRQLPAYYRSADVLILPSLYEGFGRVLLEGYLFETPAVATRCGGPEDIILDQESGFLTDIEDLDGFADRLLWLLDHPVSALEMGQRGKRYVEEAFAPQKLVDAMVGQWQALGAGEPGR